MQDEDRAGLDLIPALTLNHESPSCRAVTDADEEIFFLYTLSAAAADRRGLGQVDNHNDLLQVTVHLHDTNVDTEILSIDASDKDDEQMPNRVKRATKSSARSNSKSVKGHNPDTLQIIIRQSSTSLRSTGGDTGSVVWRSSVYLAEKVLRDLSEAMKGKKRHASEAVQVIFAPERLTQCRRILELGSGTGILPSMLLSHPFIDRTDSHLQWLATDQANMMPLLRKNLTNLPRAHVEALDWVDASHIYRSQSQVSIKAFLRDMFKTLVQVDEEIIAYPDLIIATDCIFNPFLFVPFVDTLNLCSSPYKTIVIVVCELREAEAMTEFLQTWMSIGRKGEKWTIHTLEGLEVLGQGLVKGSVIWVAWRTS
ncbi:hypothetical protein CBS101457_002061 [Exobasidium rhododendri]|nr:hypothetical protein CBS101457_002061 [Exobasidium rhododendri]